VVLDVYHQAAAGLQPADQGVAGAAVLLRQGGCGQARVLVERCGVMATAKTCPHPDDKHVVLSGTQVRAMLAAGQLPRPEFSRAEMAQLEAVAFAVEHGVVEACGTLAWERFPRPRPPPRSAISDASWCRMTSAAVTACS